MKIFKFSTVLFFCITLCCFWESCNRKNNSQEISDTIAQKAQAERHRLDSLVAMDKAHNDSLDAVLKEQNESKIKELSGFFYETKDEFSNDNLVWIKPKDAPKTAGKATFYCYFQKKASRVENFRFKFVYVDDGFLHINSVKFNVDGKVYEFYPDDVESDLDYDKCWEWCDKRITNIDLPLIRAIADANTVKVKFVGDQYYDTRTLTKSQILSIKRTLDYFIALNGHF